MSAATMNEMERLRRERDFWHRVADMEKTQRISLELGAKIPEVVAERDALAAKLARYSMCAGRADQRQSESRAVRKALGFNPDADDVSPRDLLGALARLKAQCRRDVVTQLAEAFREAWPEHNGKHAWILGAGDKICRQAEEVNDENAR